MKTEGSENENLKKKIYMNEMKKIKSYTHIVLLFKK